MLYFAWEDQSKVEYTIMLTYSINGNCTIKEQFFTELNIYNTVEQMKYRYGFA